MILCRRDGRAVLAKAREFLSRLGLTLNVEKTHVVSVWKGFEFLGMTFRYRKTSPHAKKLKYACYRWPRKKAVAALKDKIRQKIGRRYSLSLDEVIKEINPIIAGWHRYFRVGNGELHFRRLDRFIQNRLRIFVKRKHSNPSRGLRKLVGGLLERLGLYRLARGRVSIV